VPRIKTESFSQPDPDGWCSLHYNMLGRIKNCIPYLLYITSLYERTGWTTVDTLTAIGTYHIMHRFVIKGTDLLLGSLMGNRQGIHSLQFSAGPDTTLTSDTFAVILYDGRGGKINH
jgi:hypothetical protein